MGASAVAQAGPGEDVATIYRAAASARPADGAPMSEWSRYTREKSQAAVRASAVVYQAYLGRRWNDEEAAIVSAALCESDRSPLQAEIQQTFFSRSLDRLSAAGATGKKLALLVRGNQFQLFRLGGHWDPAGDVDGRAGFHRGRGSIYMDFSRIDPDEWLLIFAHEITHQADTRLADATQTFNRLDLNREVALLASGERAALALTEGEEKSLDLWLQAGLDRGFLAEVRAWAVTVALYLELRPGGLKKIDWLEEFTATRAKGAPLIRTVFRYLDSRFIDPATGYFTVPKVAARLQALRAKLRSPDQELALPPGLDRVLTP